MKIEDVAAVCHMANKGYCEVIGDFSQPPWCIAEDWQKQSAINGVRFVLENPFSTPADQHTAWAKEKMEQGWVYGPVKDVEKKQHPCLVSYKDLPEHQRIKDDLFRGVVTSLSDFIDDE